MRIGQVFLVFLAVLARDPSAAPAAAAPELLHYYRFDTDATDAAGFSNGTFVGGAQAWEGMADLDGESGYVQFADALVPVSGSYTVSLLVRHSIAQTGFGEWISQGASGRSPFYLGHDPSRKIRVGDAWTNTGVAAAAADGLFHHYAIVVDAAANQSRLYVDGVVKATVARLIPGGGGGTTRIGRQFGIAGEYHNGGIDDLRVFGGALSDAEIAALADPGPPRPRRLPMDYNGLHGYLITNTGTTPAGFGYGVSFYSTIWNMLAQTVRGLQIGLIGTWISPDNRDFQTPLCPPGTTARDNWPERGPTWSDVFQTIEGSAGYWASTRFPSVAPKFRMNGTPDCYDNQISTPGWGFGGGALPADKLGLAQISNRLIAPPDGFTFTSTESRALFGYGWIALPLTPARTRDAISTGNRNWTLFLNTANFRGPVAYYTADSWSALSARDSSISGRGLDARDGRMPSLAMEIGGTPMFEATASSGVRYRRIPRLAFPLDAARRSVLVQDARSYGSSAIFDAVGNWIDGGPVPAGVNVTGTREAALSAGTPFLDSGPSNQRSRMDVAAIVRGGSFPTAGGGSSGGLEWLSPSADGVLPEYYRETAAGFVAVPVDQVPRETWLANQAFFPATTQSPYTLTTSGSSPWSSANWKAGPFTTNLADGTTVEYVWYRFVEQPAIARLGLDPVPLQKLQAWAESLHRACGLTCFTIPPPTSGSLIALDTAQFVTPPRGLEAGYVPIVISQRFIEPQSTLTITTSGSGTVTSSSGGINCGTVCSATYNANTSVVLTATPASGSVFAGWGGGSDCLDGAVTMISGHGCTAAFVTVLGTSPARGSIDLNGDGGADVFRYNSTTGAWSMEYANRTGAFGSLQRSWTDGWSVQAGDFNGDGLTDMFLYNSTTGQWSKATNNGAGNFTNAGATWSSGWTPYVFDLSGDGKSDVFLYNRTTGTWVKCISTGTGTGEFTYASGSWSPNWDLYPADFNGDGKGDLFLFSAATGDWFRAQNDGGSGFTYISDRWGAGWGIWIADFNGDGKSDVFLFNATTGQRVICTTTATSFTYVPGLWSPEWQALMADFDGNRKADVWLYNATTGVWFEAMNNGAGDFTYLSGTTGTGYTTFVSDFNGDGKSDVLFYNATTGAYVQAITNGTGTFTTGSGTWATGSTIIAATTRVP